jgi:hypothetical protein
MMRKKTRCQLSLLVLNALPEDPDKALRKGKRNKDCPDWNGSKITCAHKFPEIVYRKIEGLKKILLELVTQ